MNVLRLLGIRSLAEITLEMLNGKEVTVVEYPEGTSGLLKTLPSVRVKVGEPEKEEWRIPYLKLIGPEGNVNVYGKPEGVLIPGLGEVMVYLSKAKDGIKAELPKKTTLRVYVYPGIPCYFALKEVGKLISVKNLNIEIIIVDNDTRHRLLISKGFKAVPSFEVNEMPLFTGRASAEQLLESIKGALRSER